MDKLCCDQFQALLTHFRVSTSTLPVHRSVREGFEKALTSLTPAAITENKRLGDVLDYIKDRENEQKAPAVKTNSDKHGCVKRPRGPGRQKDFMNDPAVIARREKALLGQPVGE